MGKITNRVSFVIIVDTGQINPSVYVDSGFNASINDVNAVSENEILNQYAVAIDSSGNTLYGRAGISTNEINLKPIIDELVEAGLVSQYLEKISSSEANTGEMVSDPAYSWYDINHFFSKLDISSDISKNLFYNQFSFISQPAPEAFWISDDPADITKTKMKCSTDSI